MKHTDHSANIRDFCYGFRESVAPQGCCSPLCCRKDSQNLCITSTAKERDEETGFNYHGARYYDASLLTGWLSVDPLADKYPEISSYNYCAWNPVKLVDPDGKSDSIVLHGDELSRKSALIQMSKMLTNIKLSVDNYGVLSYMGTPSSETETYIVQMINSSDVIVNLYVQTTDKITNAMGVNNGGGSFMGNYLEFADDGTAIRAQANQFVNVVSTRNNDQNRGVLIWHETSEAFEGGLISKDRGFFSPTNGDMCVYAEAHNRANTHFCGNLTQYELQPGTVGYSLNCNQ